MGTFVGLSSLPRAMSKRRLKTAWANFVSASSRDGSGTLLPMVTIYAKDHFKPSRKANQASTSTGQDKNLIILFHFVYIRDCIVHINTWCKPYIYICFSGDKKFNLFNLPRLAVDITNIVTPSTYAIATFSGVELTRHMVFSTSNDSWVFP